MNERPLKKLPRKGHNRSGDRVSNSISFNRQMPSTIWDSSLAVPVDVPLFDAVKRKQSGRIAEYQGLISKLATYLAQITKPGIYNFKNEQKFSMPARALRMSNVR